MTKPDQTEYAPYFEKYISLVPEGEIVATLGKQIESTLSLILGLSADQGDHRYAPDKWSVKTLVNHLSDVERVFAYRLLRIARGDPTPLPGFEENDYARAALSDRRPFSDVLAEWLTVRDATSALAASLPEGNWANVGTSSDAPMSARALLYIVLGHTEHHLAVLADRYGVR